jgi:hypothetical protein
MSGEKMTHINASVLILALDGTGQALQNKGPDKYNELFSHIRQELNDVFMSSGGGIYGVMLPMSGWHFSGLNSSSDAMKAAIRIVSFFKENPFADMGISCRIAIDSGLLIKNETGLYGEPFSVALDLVSKARANTIFITERAALAGGSGFCFDEVSRLRLKGYEEKISTKVLCGHV